MSSFYSLPHRRYRSPSAIGGWVGSCRGASTRAQCHVVFRRLGIGLKWWGRPPGRCELIDFLKTGHKFRGCVMYPVAPRIACTACKREVFFAIRLQHARLQLIHIFPGPALLSTKPVSIRARVLDAEPRLLPGDRNEARAARGRSY